MITNAIFFYVWGRACIPQKVDRVDNRLNFQTITVTCTLPTPENMRAVVDSEVDIGTFGVAFT